MTILGYAFVTLTQDQRDARRLALDQRANTAQFSQGIVIFSIVLFKYLYVWLQQQCLSKNHPAQDILRGLRRLKWSLDNELVSGFGSIGSWLGGITWGLWLMYLCVDDTAPDYLHLTKRFGLIAVSQLPIHYFLAMKSSYSPLQIVTRNSHESLNTFHRILGYIIVTFFSLHVIFYLNFIILAVNWKRLLYWDIVFGLSAISTFIVMVSSSLPWIRKIRYQRFYLLHVLGSTVVLPLLYFHVSHLRIYILEAMFFLGLNYVVRILETSKVEAEIQLLSETNLFLISCKTLQTQGQWSPGQHIYLRLKAPGIISYIQSNPFTISTLPEDQSTVIIGRIYAGSTQKLVSLSSNTTTTNLYLEGPYGDSQYMRNSIEFDNIILVAGGVGATYIIPLYMDMVRKRLGRKLKQNVRLVWVVRNIEETQWTLGRFAHADNDQLSLHVTGNLTNSDWDSYELEDMGERSDQTTSKEMGIRVERGRPNFGKIIDDVFSTQNGTTAVYVCGPTNLTRDLRRHTGKWVAAGRDIHWHVEDFGL